MKKILDYIRYGEGLGIKFLLPFSLIVAIFLAATVKIEGNDVLVPAAQKVADEFLPIKIENGVIVEPADTVKTYSIAFDDENNDVNSNINVVLDTKVDYFEPSELKQGIYISRRALYSVTKRETKMYNFEESLYIPQGDYSDLFKTILNWSVLFVGIFGFIGVAIGFFIAIIFYAVCSYAVSAFLGKSFLFDLRMRLSTLAFMTTYVVFTVLGWFGFSSFIIFFVAVLALQGVIFKEIPAQETPAAPQQN